MTRGTGKPREQNSGKPGFFKAILNSVLFTSLKVVNNENGGRREGGKLRFTCRLVMSFSCEKNLFPFPLNTANLKGDFFHNRECAANCSVRFPYLKGLSHEKDFKNFDKN
jgi:hypothetical protein